MFSVLLLYLHLNGLLMLRPSLMPSYHMLLLHLITPVYPACLLLFLTVFYLPHLLLLLMYLHDAWLPAPAAPAGGTRLQHPLASGPLQHHHHHCCQSPVGTAVV